MSLNRLFMLSLLTLAATGCFFSSSASAWQSVGESKPKPPSQRVKALSAHLHQVEKQLQVLATQIDQSQHELDMARTKHEELIRDKGPNAGLSVSSFGEIVGYLQSQKVALTIDLAGLDARQSAIEEAAKKASQSGKHNMERQVMIDKLHQIVNVQRQKLEQAEKLRKQGSASEGDFQDAERQLLEAEIRLADATASFGQAEDSTWNQQLIAVSLDRAEKQARLQRVEDLLAQYAATRPSVDQVNELNQVIGQLNARVQELQRDHAERQTEVELLNDELSNAQDDAASGDDDGQ